MRKWIKSYSSIDDVHRVVKILPDNMVVVYTYGVWDLLHPGHIKLMIRAKDLGDFLIVGVVEDGPVRKLKGEGRPVQNLEERLFNVGALRCVDAAIIQGKYDPSEEMKAIRKINILTKGDDWENIPGTKTIHELGGKLIKLPYSPEHSTSSMVAKISGKPKTNHGEPEC
ncbi:MAG: adenylyltransferase/cytidyltransferase family protein [Candidatus Scalindua sp.]|jgi:rfaE bifunctional protein nucleotidyltransferase chain/domain|nr:adenylyltransferase/cytidyltransferase family protein [Candidatus Scalindua sp.]